MIVNNGKVAIMPVMILGIMKEADKPVRNMMISLKRYAMMAILRGMVKRWRVGAFSFGAVLDADGLLKNIR